MIAGRGREKFSEGCWVDKEAVVGDQKTYRGKCILRIRIQFGWNRYSLANQSVSQTFHLHNDDRPTQ